MHKLGSDASKVKFPSELGCLRSRSSPFICDPLSHLERLVYGSDPVRCILSSNAALHCYELVRHNGSGLVSTVLPRFEFTG